MGMCTMCGRMAAGFTYKGKLMCSWCLALERGLDKLRGRVDAQFGASSQPSPAGNTLSQRDCKESPMAYKTQAEVKAYVAAWLRYVSNMPCAQPTHHRLLRLGAPKSDQAPKKER